MNSRRKAPIIKQYLACFAFVLMGAATTVPQRLQQLRRGRELSRRVLIDFDAKPRRWLPRNCIGVWRSTTGFFKQEQKFAIRRIGIANPIIGPFHRTHYMAFVINLYDINEASILLHNVIQLVCGGPSSRTVRQNDPSGFRVVDESLDRL